MFSFLSAGEPSEYGFLPAGVYEGKIVKMEEGISQGAKTRGCPQLAVHIRAFGPEGAATASGPPEPVRHDDVILWPWEIEQKGGQQ